MLLLFQVNFVFTVIRIFYSSSFKYLLKFREDLFPQFLGCRENAKLKINKIVRFRCQAGRTSVCFSLYFCLRRLSIYYHQECIKKKKKSDGDYNVKRLTRRLTRIKSVDARNIIRNVGRMGDFKTREIFEDC